MFRNVVSRIVELVLRRDFEYSEFQGAVIATCWGLWLLNPWYDVLVVSGNYRALAVYGPDHAWGALFLAIGFGQLAGVIFRFHEIRRWSAFLAALLWTFVAVLVARVSPFSLSVPTTSMFAVGAAWGYLRIGMSRESTHNASDGDC